MAQTLPVPLSRLDLAPAPIVRVLVIDDDQLVTRSIKRMLHALEVVTESDPRAALDRIRRGERFAVVLCDLRMPHLSGREVLAAIRAHFAGRSAAPALVAMSGDEDELVDERWSLLKPFHATALRSLLAGLVASPA